MAPEQISDAKYVDHRADIYSVGRILYEVLTTEAPEFNRDVDLSKVPSRYSYIVRKATRFHPEERYQSIGALLDDINLTVHVGSAFDRPSESALEIYSQLAGADSSPAQDLFSRLARLFVENRDDFHLLVHVLPRIPAELLPELIAAEIDIMQVVLRAYDLLIEEPLAIEYCEIVTRFYESLFNASQDTEIRSLVLRRLATMGSAYDRWETGQLLARLIPDTRDTVVLADLADHLVSNPAAAVWCRQFLRGLNLSPAIRAAVYQR
jgi:serine/threonine protein kinase